MKRYLLRSEQSHNSNHKETTAGRLTVFLVIIFLVNAAVFSSCSPSPAGSVSQNSASSDFITYPVNDADVFDPSVPRTYTLTVNTGVPALVDTGVQNDIPDLLPESVTYYKTSYYGSSYDGVACSYENGVIYLEITPDIDDGMLTHARVSFTLPEMIPDETDTAGDDDSDEDIPERGCYFTNPDPAHFSYELPDDAQSIDPATITAYRDENILSGSYHPVTTPSVSPAEPSEGGDAAVPVGNIPQDTDGEPVPGPLPDEGNVPIQDVESAPLPNARHAAVTKAPAAADEEEEDIPYLNSNGTIDLTKNPILYIVDENGNISAYPVVTRRQTFDIPTLFLTTDMGASITSKYEYVSGNMIVDGTDYEISIRGRGNTSWRYFRQKSYMLKFDERISFFGMIPSDKWVLVSTFKDPSLIRNCVAMDISAFMDHLEYTPEQIPVDVYLNGEYLGVYTFSEKIDVDMQKINMFASDDYRPPVNEDDGEEELDLAFFLECGGDLMIPHVYSQEYFMTAHSPRMFFKYPVLDAPYSDEFYYVYHYMNALDQSLVRGYGYEDYIDVDSWVDWFIVMELTNNTDSAFWRSSFLYRRPGEKVMLGPVWDFDMAFGNFSYDNPSYAYWATAEQVYDRTQNHYMSYLYRSNDFMLAVQERWDEVKEDLLATALDSVDRNAELVAASRVYNSHVRGSGTSEYNVTSVRNFIQRRYDWIDRSLHMYGYNRHPAPFTVTDVEEEEPVPDETIIPVDENGLPIIPVDENGQPVIPSGNEAPTPEN